MPFRFARTYRIFAAVLPIVMYLITRLELQVRSFMKFWRWDELVLSYWWVNSIKHLITFNGMTLVCNVNVNVYTYYELSVMTYCFTYYIKDENK